MATEVSMETMRFGQPAPDTLVVLGPDEIDQLPWKSVPGCPGVHATELWRSGNVHDALISYEPDASTPGNPHPNAHHDIWVVSGSASVAGRRVVAGSYVYVPPATAHPIADVGPEGCTILQMHRPLQQSFA
jgi:ChrR Cupin-like domain